MTAFYCIAQKAIIPCNENKVRHEPEKRSICQKRFKRNIWIYLIWLSFWSQGKVSLLPWSLSLRSPIWTSDPPNLTKPVGTSSRRRCSRSSLARRSICLDLLLLLLLLVIVIVNSNSSRNKRHESPQKERWLSFPTRALLPLSFPSLPPVTIPLTHSEASKVFETSYSRFQRETPCRRWFSSWKFQGLL